MGEGYRLDCGAPPVAAGGGGACAHLRGYEFKNYDSDVGGSGVSRSQASPGAHLADSSKVSFSFRLFGCIEGNPSQPNMSDALRNYDEEFFEVYEDRKLQRKTTIAELAYSVRQQQDYLYNFLTLLLDMSKSVASKQEYFEDLKRAIKELVPMLVPPNNQQALHKLKLRILAFAGGSDRSTVNHVLLDYQCSSDVVSKVTDLVDGLSHPEELFADYRSTALNLAVSVALSDLIATVDDFDADFVSGTLVAFTDGDDTAGTYPTSSLYEELDSVPPQVNMFSIGVGNVSEAKLKRIGVDGYVKVSSSDSLQEGFSQVTRKLMLASQNRYLLEYCSPKRGGEHDIQVQVRSQSAGSACRFYFDASDFDDSCRLGFTLPSLDSFGCKDGGKGLRQPDENSGGVMTSRAQAMGMLTAFCWTWAWIAA
eukprot:evm.model.scf_907.7 EVM.evm.TU.scf_907.7   scf_907:51432-55617(+)